MVGSVRDSGRLSIADGSPKSQAARVGCRGVAESVGLSGPNLRLAIAEDLPSVEGLRCAGQGGVLQAPVGAGVTRLGDRTGVLILEGVGV